MNDVAKRRSRNNHLQLLIAPVKWTTTMAIKRQFEDREIPARIIGAGTAEAAISQLGKNERYNAILIDWQASPTEGLELACAVKEKGHPPIVAFQSHWPRDDIRRALQLGVDCLLLNPFSPEDLTRDLRSIQETGMSASRRQILDEGGDLLLESDPGLWDGQTDDWRERMMGLADQLSRPWSEDMSDRASHMEVSVRRKAQIDGLTPTVARAVMEILDTGRDRLPAIAARHRLNPSELVYVLGAVERFAKKHGGSGSIPLLLDEVLKRDPNLGPDSNAPKLMLLKRVARVVIRAGGKVSRGRDALNDTLKKFLGAPPSITKQIIPQERYNLAVRFLMCESEQDAIDQAAFVVLGALVNPPDPEAIGEEHFDALSALLGLDGRHEGIDPKKLVRLMANLHPLPVLARIDLKQLSMYQDLLGQVAKPYPALDSALDQLTKVARPLGPIDQKRLSDLYQAVRMELSVLVGPAAWQSLLHLFNFPVPAPLKILESKLTFIMGARTERSRQLLSEAIEQLVAVGKNAMDAARFANFCRQASAEPLSADVIAEFVGETHDEFSPNKVERTGAAEARALVEQALNDFSNVGVDLNAVRASMPPAPWGYDELGEQDMARMRALAAVLDNRPLDEQRRILRRFLGSHKLHPEEVEALELMLGKGEVIDEIRGRFFDPSAADRPGFDYAYVDDSQGQDDPGFDYADDFDDFDALDDLDDDVEDAPNDELDLDDEWDDDDELDGMADDFEGGTFDMGAAPPPRLSNPAQPVEVDLGLEELELELDLSGGVFELEESVLVESDEASNQSSMDTSVDSSVIIRRDRRWRLNNLADSTSGRQSWNTTMSEPMHDELPERVDAAPPGRRRSNPSMKPDDGEAELPMGGSLSGFDLGGPPPETSRKRTRRFDRRSEPPGELPLTPDGQLDLDALGLMVKTGKLKNAARLLHSCDEDIEGLADGLNLVALHAFSSDRHRAAHMLWSKAEKLKPRSPNILYNVARLRVQLGHYSEARRTLDTLLEVRPHLSLAHELSDVLDARLGN
ncbi:MAG: hypothetical protein VX589_02245 [Myxococcota bacterium]|nr:hypothetical protein [Myxococcota bacterium]